jgi:hypothetical protein
VIVVAAPAAPAAGVDRILLPDQVADGAPGRETWLAMATAAVHTRP